MVNTTDSAADVADQVLEQEEKDRKALAMLLARQLGNNNKILVQKTRMAENDAFVGSVTLEWFANEVRFASQLPLFRRRIEAKTNKLVIDSETIDLVQQRPLDWSRYAVLAQYLAVRKSHKFPPVLVAGHAHWADNLEAPEWGEGGRSVKTSITFTPLDNEGTVGLIDISDLILFALDGQHRLMGALGLMQLIKTGVLEHYNKDKKLVSSFKIEDLADRYEVEQSYIQSLGKERIGIEFVPAVLEGETHEEARRRMRSVFVHVNDRAMPITKGQLAQLNEDDGFAIVARKAAVLHPLLITEGRVNWNNSTVATNSAALTTLQTLTVLSEVYLIHKYPGWKADLKGAIPQRPRSSELKDGLEEFLQLFDQIANLPTMSELKKGKTTGQFRRFKNEGDGGQGHMLFRPVGQIALAEALGILVFREHMSLESLFGKLKKFDQNRGFEMEKISSLWYMVLYDPNKERVLVRGEKLAARLLRYLLGGIPEGEECEKLRQNLAEERTTEGLALGFDGQDVPPKEIDLPDPL